jgi:Peptidase_C39 like family
MAYDFSKIAQKPEEIPTLNPVGFTCIPRVFQTMPYTCGPCSIRMVANILEFRPDMQEKELAIASGANPKTGTTEVEMAKGLNALLLEWTRPSKASMGGEPLEHLREAIADGKVVLLRTMLPGGMKHWVVVHGYDRQNDVFLVTCAGMGGVVWKSAILHQMWKQRDYDHFLVSADRNQHPRAVADEKTRRIAAWKPVHKMTLSEFTMDRPVVEKLGQEHFAWIDGASKAILAMQSRKDGRPMDYADAPGFIFLAMPRNGITHNMLVLDANNGQVAGGIADGLRWVAPEYRGRGLGMEIALAAYSEPETAFLYPGSYSIAGLRSREAAWKLAIKRNAMKQN